MKNSTELNAYSIDTRLKLRWRLFFVRLNMFHHRCSLANNTLDDRYIWRQKLALNLCSYLHRWFPWIKHIFSPSSPQYIRKAIKWRLNALEYVHKLPAHINFKATHLNRAWLLANSVFLRAFSCHQTSGIVIFLLKITCNKMSVHLHGTLNS